MRFSTQLNSNNPSPLISNMSSKQLHRIPWFLIGAMASTISTVYIYFNNRPIIPIHKFPKNSTEPPHILVRQSLDPDLNPWDMS